MKKPVFTYEQRHNFLITEIEIAKLKFRREFEKTRLFKVLEKIIDFLAKILKK